MKKGKEPNVAPSLFLGECREEQGMQVGQEKNESQMITGDPFDLSWFIFSCFS